MSDELKPCPFCNWPAALTVQEGIAWVSCIDCGCEGPTEEDGSSAIAAWNRRAPVTLPSDVVQVPENETQARMMMAVAMNYLGLGEKA